MALAAFMSGETTHREITLASEPQKTAPTPLYAKLNPTIAPTMLYTSNRLEAKYQEQPGKRSNQQRAEYPLNTLTNTIPFICATDPLREETEQQRHV
ncbi:hypothetical protein VNO80_13647 [Phaseolus coccineus]|uniref:Uncharacterized protein n=1 Tax=Phaseolus coccineus TaxID=3886 RepID=A0AAN9N3F0_PHACN